MLQYKLAGSVRRNKIFANSTDNDIDNVIKTWLAGSCDRDGGRNSDSRGQKRKLKKMTARLQELLASDDSDD